MLETDWYKHLLALKNEICIQWEQRLVGSYYVWVEQDVCLPVYGCYSEIAL